MLIQVAYPDNRYDYVKEQTLDRLIESRNIARFKRSSGWVTIGVDPIRRARREHSYDPSFQALRLEPKSQTAAKTGY